MCIRRQLKRRTIDNHAIISLSDRSNQHALMHDHLWGYGLEDGAVMMQKPRVFVSHSSEDNAFTHRLVADLTAAGADVWVDFDFIHHGDFAQRINEGFAGRQWFILVLSPSAVRSSWVEREVNAAMSLLTEKRLRGIIGIVAKSVKSSDVPPLWVNLQRYDATYDYARAVQNVLAAMGMGNAVPDGRSHLIVDPNRSGGYKSLADALAAADPGDEIAIYPAVYTETLNFGKSVHLIGQGKAEDIILAPPDKNGVLITADNVRFTNLSVWIGAPTDVSDLVKQHKSEVAQVTAAVAIGGAAAIGLIALFFIMPAASVVLGGISLFKLFQEFKEDRDKEESAKLDASIEVIEHASLALHECFIRNSIGSGLRVSGQVSVTSSRIFACNMGGVMIFSGAQGDIEDSEIIANRVVGIYVDGAVTLRRNKITGNKPVGIKVGDEGSGAWSDNILGGNAKRPWDGDAAALARITSERNAV